MKARRETETTKRVAMMAIADGIGAGAVELPAFANRVRNLVPPLALP